MRKTKIRISAVTLGLAIGFVVIWGRAAQLQLWRGEEYREAAIEQRTARVNLPATRGGIYDRGGVPLVLTKKIFRLGIAPNELKSGRSDAEVAGDIGLIAGTLGLSADQIRRAVNSSRYAYFRGPFSPSQIHQLGGIPGLHPEGELSRFYPDPDLARAVLGRPPAEGIPATGIERLMDSVLAGTPGSAVVLQDQRGRRYESPGRPGAFPVAGNDVFLTIDAELQEIVQSALAAALRDFQAIGGDVVVLDPHTGEVLAMASLDSSGRERLSPISTPYEPGSTAKLFAAAALLENQLVSLQDTVWGEGGRYEFGGRTINDVHEVEWATLPAVIENSSNIGIVKFTRRLNASQQFNMLRRFGFGTPTGLNFAGESRGTLRLPAQWSGFSSASLAMGYEFAATPLQLAVAYSAIANDGLLLRPTLINRVVSSEGAVVWKHRREPVRRAVSAGTADTLRQMLKGVVYRGSQAALTSYEVAGKTGTTRRVGDTGAYVPGAYNASFASLFPADDPQLVMVVKLEDPRGTYGSQTAAPVTREVLERALAARTMALDRASLSIGAAAVDPRGFLEYDTQPVFFDLPLVDPVVVTGNRVMPSVTGLTIREALGLLHERGLEVRLEGWGTVASTSPAAGDTVAVGATVRVIAGSPR